MPLELVSDTKSCVLQEDFGLILFIAEPLASQSQKTTLALSLTASKLKVEPSLAQII